ncbi:MAG TPA: diguanylate cyclase [Solirubrobacteraceae bacterium]|jgi:GGDEF domain-containing protein
MQHGPPRRRRARAVADAPTDALLLRTDDLTKGWLLALLEQAPLEDAPAIVAADIARDGPRICDAAVRALADDGDLRRLEPGGALEPLVSRTGDLAGAGGAAAVAAVVDALEAVLWSAVRSEVRDDDAELVSELAERVALVAGLIRAAALRRVGAEVGPMRPAVPGPRSSQPQPPPAPPGPRSPQPPPPARPGPHLDPSATRPPSPRLRPAVVAPEPASGEASSEPAAPERPPEALWIGALEDELARAQKADSLLSLLLVELEDAERVRTADTESEASSTFGRFAQALRTVVRRQDILACETESRAWIIARDTGRAGATALATRTSKAVREARPWRGGPMTVNAGIAVYREDGHDAATLIDAAEQAKFAAAAAGLTVIRDLPPDGGGGAGPRLAG